MTNYQFQQGDLLFVGVDPNALDLLKYKRSREKGNVIAKGERTGHAHVLTGDDVVLYRGIADGDFCIEAPKGATITHEEHAPVVLPPGTYLGSTVQTLDITDERKVPAPD